jgi:hypothetical protein
MAHPFGELKKRRAKIKILSVKKRVYVIFDVKY